MAHFIEYKGQGFWISNRNFSAVLSMLLERCDPEAASAEDAKEFARLRSAANKGLFWPGRGIQIEEDIPAPRAMEFWAEQLRSLANEILEDKVKLGNNEQRLSAIYMAVGFAEVLSIAVASERKLH